MLTCKQNIFVKNLKTGQNQINLTYCKQINITGFIINSEVKYFIDTYLYQRLICIMFKNCSYCLLLLCKTDKSCKNKSVNTKETLLFFLKELKTKTSIVGPTIDDVTLKLSTVKTADHIPSSRI